MSHQIKTTWECTKKLAPDCVGLSESNDGRYKSHVTCIPCAKERAKQWRALAKQSSQKERDDPPTPPRRKTKPIPIVNAVSQPRPSPPQH